MAILPKDLLGPKLKFRPFFSIFSVGWLESRERFSDRTGMVRCTKRHTFLVRNWVERDPSPAASRWHFGPERTGLFTFCFNAATAILPLSPVALTMVQQTSERFI